MMMTDDTKLAWLLGDLDGDEFSYTLYDTIRPRHAEQTCVRLANAEVTACGRHVDRTDRRQDQVYITCRLW